MWGRDRASLGYERGFHLYVQDGCWLIVFNNIILSPRYQYHVPFRSLAGDLQIPGGAFSKLSSWRDEHFGSSRKED